VLILDEATSALDAESEAEIAAFMAEWSEDHDFLADADEDEETDFPRYQIQIHLVDGEWLP